VLLEEHLIAKPEVAVPPPDSARAVLRVAAFFCLIGALIFGLDGWIGSGFRKLQTSQYGVLNQVMNGQVNAQIVVTGSSRAASHYDPRILQTATGRSVYNIGRNGSQTDMQVALLRAYLEHNRKPEMVIHNLDAFSFQTSREIYDPVYYLPYIGDEEFYRPLQKINPEIWKSRYLPLYGYVVEDMNFAWTAGVRGALGLSPREEFFLGFNPRTARWTDEFARFRADRPDGVRWEIEPAGVTLMNDLAKLCQERGIRLVLVYSPEYSEMQRITTNRTEVFAHFGQLAAQYRIPLWDFSAWPHASETEYFSNSQHLNDVGAEAFSRDLGRQLAEFLSQDHP